MRQKATKVLFETALELHHQGFSYREIEKKIGVAKSAIHRWITIFAEECSDMNNNDNTQKPQRAIGVQAPIATPIKEKVIETDSEKIIRLEKELKEAKMRADLYNEIINVAEQKFNIQIRKKVGTKR